MFNIIIFSTLVLIYLFQDPLSKLVNKKRL